MGRKSVKANKNIYQLKREELGLTREKASQLVDISEDRLDHIERLDRIPHPEEVARMAEGYNDYSLCNHYCTHACTIGKEHLNELEVKDLSALILDTLASLNEIEKHKDRLIEITADGVVDESEIKDFEDIQEKLTKIATTAESLKLWAKQAKIHSK